METTHGGEVAARNSAQAEHARPCFHRSTDVPVVFCELAPGHDGPHQSRAHVWERDGSGYRAVSRDERRLTIYEEESTVAETVCTCRRVENPWWTYAGIVEPRGEFEPDYECPTGNPYREGDK